MIIDKWADQVIDKVVKNGFDYRLQVWVKDYVIQNCGHRQKEVYGAYCCNAGQFAGQDIRKFYE